MPPALSQIGIVYGHGQKGKSGLVSSSTNNWQLRETASAHFLAKIPLLNNILTETPP